MKTTSVFRFGCSVFAFSLLAVGTARAQVDRSWDKLDAGVPQSGNFDVSGNWNPAGVPTADDWAIFDHEAATAYTVTMDIATHSIQGIKVDWDRLVLSVPTVNTLNLTAAPVGTGNAPTHRAFMVGNTGYGEMTVQGGGTLSSDGLWSSTTTGSTSDLTVQGAGTHLNAKSGTASTHIGYSGVGALSVLTGAKVSTADLYLARGGGSSGSSILVNGSAGATSSELNVAGHVEMGRSGVTTLTVSQGGHLSVLFDVTWGRAGNSSLIFDNGTGSFRAIRMGIAAFNVAYDHRLEVKNNSVLTTTGYFDVRVSGGTSATPSTGTVSIESGSTVNIGTDMTVGLASANSVTYMDVMGASSVNVGQRFTVTNTGRMTLHGGSTVTAQDMVGNTDGVYTLMLNTSSGLAAPLRILDGATHDGDVALGGMAFAFDFDGSPKTGTFGVLRYDGTRTGTFSGLVEDTWYTWSGDPAIEYKLNYDSNDGTGSAIMLTVIPEPHTLGLLLAAGALLALRRRRG